MRRYKIEQPFEINKARYQPDTSYIYANNPELRFDQRRLASLIGYVAIGMPIILGLGGIALDAFRQSLSGFYYERVLLGDIFVGSLVFIGTILFAYKGWSSKVALLSTIAGISAYTVALFPAAGWLVGEVNLRIYEKQTNIIHVLGALILFLILAWFCFFVFTKVEPHQRDADGNLQQAKRHRNRIYQVTGALIIFAIILIGLGNQFFPEWSVRNRLTYWAETAALIAFGVSWMVQGRASGILLQDPRDKRDEQQAQTAEANIEA